MDFEDAKRILAALEQEKVRYVLVGSMAMAVQGLIRATRDMDLFVEPDRDNIARVQRALRSLFAGDPNVDQISADELTGNYPVVQYTPPHGLYSIDLLTRLGEAFGFEDIEAEELIIEGVTIRVATPRALYRMKKDTVRPQDRIDAAAIRERFGLREDA